jgi:hypothetical protein
MEQHIIKIINSTNNLTRLYIDMFPLTSNMMEAIDSNLTAKLVDIFVADQISYHDSLSWEASQNYDPYRNQLQFIQSSRQFATIKKLSMSDRTPQVFGDNEASLKYILLDYLPATKLSEKIGYQPSNNAR